MEQEEISKVFFKNFISNKKECYLLYENGFLGNKAKTWNTFDEALKDNCRDTICIRAKKRGGAKNTRYDIPLNQVDQEISQMINEGIKPQDIAFNQSMPNKHLLIQGEVMITERGLTLFYTLAKKPMNLGFKEHSAHAYGITAKMILEKNFNPPTLSDLYALFEKFPD